jgi:predicted AAA+ superfamily ATPase
MVRRSINEDVIAQMSKYPVLAVTGPRQSGKTTMIKEVFSDYRYINLEDPDNREYAENDTKLFLKEFDNKVIIDEAQRIPKLFSYLQDIVDSKKIMGQYILSGSQNFHLLNTISQSLSGRVALFRVYPFDLGELKQAGLLKTALPEILFTGSYPAIYDRGIEPTRYFRDYIDTYIKRDITELKNIHDMNTFNRFIRLCAARAGQILNLNDLAKDSGISHTTCRQWLSLLEASFITFTLPPYYENFSKRLIKSPKLYFYDTGLLCNLLGLKQSSLSPLNKSWGHLFENFIISEMVKQNAHKNLFHDYYFWRDSHGNEVDLLYSENGKLHLYEIKASTTISQSMFKGLDYLGELAKGLEVQKTLIYGGDVGQKRTNYTVVPWKDLILEKQSNN